MTNQESVYNNLKLLYRTNQVSQDLIKQPYKRVLFKNILSLIKHVPHNSILEVGCSEGQLTKELTTIAKNITAIDVVPMAVDIAKKNVSGVNFKVAALEEFKVQKKYDVIVASEVLCYVKARRKMVRKLPEVGNYLVTNQYIFDKTNIGFGSIIYELLLLRYKTLKVIWYFNLKEWRLNLCILRDLQ